MDGMIADKYKIISTLGEGGFGIAYLCENFEDNSRGVLKKLKLTEDISEEDKNIILTRFLRELNIIKNLHHQNIVNVIEVCTSPEPFLVTSYIAGAVTLKDYIANNSITPASLNKYFLQILNGLKYLHNNNIIHRDLKPSNILLDVNQDNILLIDFGTAKSFNVKDISDNLTVEQKNMVFTFGYAPPEQMDQKFIHTTDLRTDIFSFGMVCVTLLTNKFPTDYFWYNYVDELLQNSDIISNQHKILIKRCIQKNPKNRFQCCDEILKELTPVSDKTAILPGRQLGIIKETSSDTINILVDYFFPQLNFVKDNNINLWVNCKISEDEFDRVKAEINKNRNLNIQIYPYAALSDYFKQVYTYIENEFSNKRFLTTCFENIVEELYNTVDILIIQNYELNTYFDYWGLYNIIMYPRKKGRKTAILLIMEEFELSKELPVYWNPFYLYCLTLKDKIQDFLFKSFLKKNNIVDAIAPINDEVIILQINNLEYNDSNIIEVNEFIKNENLSLTSEQKEVLHCNIGPSVLIAGAGSGKTTTLINKILFLIKNNVLPENILVLTFTVKAANEIKERLNAKAGAILENRIFVSTFHALCYKIVNENYTYFKFSKIPVINPKLGEQIITKELELKALSINYSEYIYIKNEFKRNLLTPNYLTEAYKINPESIKEFIKNIMKLPETVKAADIGKLIEIYKSTSDKFKTNNIIDFDDMLLLTYQILKNNKMVRNRYQSIYKYVLVDEYQDSNLLLDVIVKTLSAPEDNILVIGDDDQSIYAFNGAIPANILQFNEYYPLAKILKLTQNFRCPKEVVDLGNIILHHNFERFNKELFTSREPDTYSINIIKTKSVSDEIENIVKEIENLRNIFFEVKIPIAILFRVSALAGKVIPYLSKAGIPYLTSNLDEKPPNFFNAVGAKVLISYLLIITEKLTSEEKIQHWNNIKYYPFKYETAEEWKQFLDLIKQGEDFINKPSEFLNLFSKNSVKNNYKLFHRQLAEILKTARTVEDITKFLETELDIISEFNKNEKYAELNKEAYFQIKQLVKDIPLLDVKNEIKRIQGETEAAINNVKNETENDISNKYGIVELMTIHKSKGKEYESIIVPFLNEGIIPLQKVLNSTWTYLSHDWNNNEVIIKNINIEEEERRLFYVAVTRAKRHLIICQRNPESKFLKEVFNQMY